MLDNRMVGLADQLYRAVGSIAANVAGHRSQLLTQISRLLLTIIPAERGHKMSEEPAPYDALPITLLDDPPMP